MLSSLQVQSELERTFSSLGSTAEQPQQAPVCSPPEVLLSFWVEQGLSATAAGRMVEEIVSSGRCYTTEQLSNKMERLQSVLPDADIAALALKDLALLDCDMSTALVNMICLVEAFPGKDIMSLLVRQPKLLWVTDMRQRIPRIFGKLQQLHPSHEHGVVSHQPLSFLPSPFLLPALAPCLTPAAQPL